MVQPFREYLRPGSAVGEVARAELRKARKRDETGGNLATDVASRRPGSLMKIPAVVLRKAVTWDFAGAPGRIRTRDPLLRRSLKIAGQLRVRRSPAIGM